MSNRSSSLIPSDPLFSLQWHLRNVGQALAAKPGQDINVTSVWPDYSGKGITIAVVDDGFEASHPDLVSNYNFNASRDLGTGMIGALPVDLAVDDHGTSVIGLIGSRAGNGIGGVGVAWDGQIIGYRLNMDLQSANVMAKQFASAVSLAIASGADIISNSWGPMFLPFDQQANQAAYVAAAKQAAQFGRQGLGMVTLFAAGNDGRDNLNVNYDPTDNLPFAIIIGASEADGSLADFSTPGASVLALAPGVGLVTTDLQSIWGANKREGVAGNYGDTQESVFTGTSGATPVAAGVVALMLNANPNLGYRDVQEILVNSARKADFTSHPKATFTHTASWNGGALLTGDGFGFGNLDTHNAVRLAESWQKTSTFANLQLIESSVTTQALTVQAGQSASVVARFAAGNLVEQMTVSVDLDATRLQDLTLALTSPGGTKSVLLDKAPTEDGPLPQKLNYTFNTVLNWGETLQGDWTLTMTNAATGAPVKLNSWSMKAFASDMTTPQTQIFTGEFSAFVAIDASRSHLHVKNGADLNASAVTGDVIFDLAQGHGQIGANTISLVDALQHRNLFSGDGNDHLIGNAVNNVLMAGRGNNVIDGGGGTDTAAYIGDRSMYRVEKVDDGFRVVSTVLSGGGTDIVKNIELVKFGTVVMPVLSALDQTIEVASFYDALFNRAPDADGLEAWIDAFLGNGLSAKQIATQFTQAVEGGIGATSTEAFVAQLYRAALDRAPDAAGLTGWVRLLDGGQADRGDVLTAFVKSAEYQSSAIHLVAQHVSQLGDFWDA